MAENDPIAPDKGSGTDAGASQEPGTTPDPGPETPAVAPLPEQLGDGTPESSAPPSGAPAPEIVFNLTEAIETLLFAAEGPLPVTRIAELTGQTDEAIAGAVGGLNLQYEQGGRTFRIHRLALGYQFYTLPEHVSWVRQLYRRQFTHRLSVPALEVLAIVAYKQPVTRPEIESLRGVDCSGPLVTLLERRLVTTAGRAHKPGSPFLYRTTREFLRYFGLESLDHLPPLDELGAFLASAQAVGETEVHDTLAIGSPTGLGPAEKNGDRTLDELSTQVAEESAAEDTAQRGSLPSEAWPGEHAETPQLKPQDP